MYCAVVAPAHLPHTDRGQSLPVRLPDPDDTDQTAGSAVRAHICTPAARLQQAARRSTKQRKANTEEAVRIGALSTQRSCQDASRLFLAGSRACALIVKEATVNGGDRIPDPVHPAEFADGPRVSVSISLKVAVPRHPALGFWMQRVLLTLRE